MSSFSTLTQLLPLLALLTPPTRAQSQNETLTTTIWMPVYSQPPKLRYHGSIVSYDSSRSVTTIAITYTPDSETSLLDPYSTVSETITVGPNLYESSTSDYRPAAYSTMMSLVTTWDLSQSVYCTRPTTVSSALPTCTYAVGHDLVVNQDCGYEYQGTTPWIHTQAITYSADTNSPSAEQTLVYTFVDLPTVRPSWCEGKSGSALRTIKPPKEAVTETSTLSKWNVISREIVVTAGVEKLSNAPKQTPTGESSGAGGASGGPSGTGAAGPRITAAPVFMGMGVGVGMMGAIGGFVL